MVFEEQVAYYLDKYLGKFVKGLSKEALKISVWAGTMNFFFDVLFHLFECMPLKLISLELKSLSPEFVS